MGWLRLVGSLKLQVSFAEYRLFYRALLQKRPNETYMNVQMTHASSAHSFLPRVYAAQEWSNRPVAKHACSKMGRAAARRYAPKQPRVIRAGPHPGGTQFGPPIPGVYRNFFDTGGLSDFPLKIWGFIKFFWCFLILGVYLIFHQKSGGLSQISQISQINPGIDETKIRLNPGMCENPKKIR